MKGISGFNLKIFLGWLLFFIAQRLVFLLCTYNTFSETPWIEILQSYQYGFVYDVSFSCYLTVIPFLASFLFAMGWVKSLSKFLNWYSILVLSIVSLIACSDIGMYYSWGTKLNQRALSYLIYPSEVVQTIARTPDVIWLFVLLFVEVFFGLWLFKRLDSFPFSSGKKAITVISFVIIAPILLIGIRGGTQTFPINKSQSYYSKRQVLNMAAMNSPWNLFYDLIHPYNKKNKYVFFEEADAQKIIQEFYHAKSDSVPNILRVPKPNIVFIHLESWSAEVIGSIGGEAGVTPFFDSLSASGLLYTNFYASGYRTEHGLVSMMCGFPAQPKTSVIRDFGKFEKLPLFPLQLDSSGYQTVAYYGGNLRFANSGPFLVSAGYKKVYGENDFKYSGRTTWGAYDKDLFDFSVKDLSNVKEPFLSYIMTSTSHEPFDEVPGPKFYPGNDISSNYKNSVHYTDVCLRELFANAQKEKWFDNTLFILVADHSSYYPNLRDFTHNGRFRIPFLIAGGALKPEFRGKKMQEYFTHFDIPYSLLQQLNMNYSQYNWSKNIFDTNGPSFSYFTFEDGFGVITKNQFVFYDNDSKKIANASESPEHPEIKKLCDFGKAMEQLVQQQYLNLE